MIYCDVDIDGAQALDIDITQLSNGRRRALMDRLGQLLDAADAGIDPRDPTGETEAPRLPWRVELRDSYGYPIQSLAGAPDPLNKAREILGGAPIEGDDDVVLFEDSHPPVDRDAA